MSHLKRLSLMLTALWWGGISALSFVAVPMLFARLGQPALAGSIAAQWFQVQAYTTVVVAVVLLVQRQLLLWPLVALMAALLQETLVAGHIQNARALGENLRVWHSLGSGLVLLQWVGAGLCLWNLLPRQDGLPAR